MEIRGRFKQTEVGLIPEDWEVKSFAELFNFSGGLSASREQLSTEGYCYLHYGDIHGALKSTVDTDIDYHNIPKLNIELNRVGSKFLLGDGDVVFVDASEDDEGTSKHLVVVNKDKRPFISGLHTIVAKSKTDELTHKYRRYCFKSASIKNQFHFYAVGTKVSGISKTNIAKLKIPIPKIIEQHVIANVLSDVDALLAAQEKLIMKKRDSKQATMQQLLSGKKRLQGFTDEWEVRRLKDISSVTKGMQLHSREVAESGKYAYLNGGISPSGFTEKSNMAGDSIAISEGGNSCGFVQFMTEPYWCGGHCYSVIPNSVNNYFFYQALKGRQSEIMGLRVGSGLPNIQKKALLDFNIQLPSTLAEQNSIANILFDMDKELLALEKQREKISAIKQGMMQELLSGKVRLI